MQETTTHPDREPAARRPIPEPVRRLPAMLAALPSHAPDPSGLVATVLAPVDAVTGWIQERRARAHLITREQIELYQRREAGDRRGEAVRLNALGKAYRHEGRYAEAIVCYKTALDIFREIGNRRGEGLSLSNLGLVYADRGNRLKAVRCFEDALDIFRQLGDRHVEGQILANLGTAYRRQGEDDRARDLWRQAVGLLNPGTSAHRRMTELLGS